VDHPVWTFARGDEILTISRQPTEDGVMLVVAGNGTPRSYFFRDADRLDVFQKDMETLLLKTGWTFRVYAPDRRRGRDRRGFPRRANDRRRWWTDGRDAEYAKRRDKDLPEMPVDDEDLAPEHPQRSK
jgi:hypothetical protein